MDKAYKYFWHIELTSRCTLACPKCPRTIHPYSYTINDLSYEDFKNFFNDETLTNFPDHKFVLCGNVGDPIYHPEFFRIIKYLKSKNRKINIITNGSFKKKEWWEKLVSLLHHYDEITFSVDGLEDTNHIYRVNSRWSDIVTAMEVVGKSHVNGYWKFIPFSHNEKQIKQAKHLAKKYNVMLTVAFSERWNGPDDPMRPSDDFLKDWDRLQVSENFDNTSFVKRIMKPNCKDYNGLYISYDGYALPCCWSDSFGVTDIDYLDINFKNIIRRFDIKNNSMNDVINSDQWKNAMQSTNNIDSACKLCKIFCSKKFDN